MPTEDGIDSNESWAGDSSSSEQDLAGAMDAAIREAETAGLPTPLYRAWNAAVLVHHQRQQHGQARGVGRGRALDLWDRVADRQKGLREKLTPARWQHVEPVLLGTLALVWSDFGRIWSPPQEGTWLEAVLQGIDDAGDPGDVEALESLVALLELVARVNLVARVSEQEDVSTVSSLELWRGVVVREAEKLIRCARCEKISPLAFPGRRSGSGDADVARFVLCLYADGETVSSDSANGLEALAVRVARGTAAEWAEGAGAPTRLAPVEADAVESLLRHLAFDSDLFASLLFRLVGYRPWLGSLEPPAVGSVVGIEQKILFVGPPRVGKTSFIFSSEQLCANGVGAPDVDRGRYPEIVLRHESGKQLAVERSQWRKGEESGTLDYTLVAEAGPLGLCRFCIVDVPGEAVMGAQAQRDGARFPELPAHIERLRPTLLAVMLEPFGQRTAARAAEETDVIHGLTRTVEELRQLGHLASADQRRAFPVYLVVNKSDRILERLAAAEGADESRVRAAGEDLGRKAFPLFGYFTAREGKGPCRTDEALRNLRHDPGLTANATTRVLVTATLRYWTKILEMLQDNGFQNITLVFSSSKRAERGDASTSSTLGVNAFWRHLWGESAPLFSGALTNYARSVFVDELREDAAGVVGLLEGGTGMGFERVPTIDAGDLTRRLTDWKQSNPGQIANDVWKEHGLDNAGSVALFSRRHCSGMRRLVEGATGRLNGFCEEWRRKLRRALEELNVDPDRKCNDFEAMNLSGEHAKWLGVRHAASLAGDGDDDSRWQTSKGLKKEHVHVYYGALRDAAICRNLDQNAFVNVKAGGWLRRKGTTSLIKVVDGASRDDHRVLLQALWLISDYGFKGSRYRRLSQGRFERDRFLLHAIVKWRPEERIGRAIGLVGRLLDVREHVGGRGGSGTNTTLADRVGDSVRGFVAGCVLDELGFNVAKLIGEDGKKAVEDVYDKLIVLVGQDRRFGAGVGEFVKGKTYVAQLTGALAGLDGYLRRNGELARLGGNFDSVLRAWAGVRFAWTIVRDPTLRKMITNDPIVVNERVQAAQQEFLEACGKYDEELERYVDGATRLLLGTHYGYLESMGLLRNLDQLRVAIEVAIKQPFAAPAQVGMNQAGPTVTLGNLVIKVTDGFARVVSQKSWGA